ncbi:hypothetical protein AADZ91_12280 [Colwelliaceae bacterium 6441]
MINKNILALAFILLSACQSNNINNATKPDNHLGKQESKKIIQPIDKEILVWQKATVIYISLEGGFFGLLTEDGKKLLPLKLPNKFQQNGALVNVLGKVNSKVVTFQQWGIPFEIQQINLIQPGQSTANKN